MLPAPGDFLSHPIASFWQAVEAWKMDVMKTSAETAAKRRKNVEDVQKRSTYRRAHGLESDDAQGLGAWTARSDAETPGAWPSLRADSPIAQQPVLAVKRDVGEKNDAPANDDSRESAYVDWEGRKRPIKKWLGIW